MAMIEAKNLTKRYRDRIAIENLTFSVNEGEILGFLGPNGAGKTTTMRILSGFVPPSEGSAKIAGFDVFEHPLEVKRRLGYLPETPPLYPEMTARGYLQFVGRLKGVPGRQLGSEIERVSNLTGIREVIDRVIKNLSKGFRQRVGVAQALLHNPPVLILDEPTVSLDPRQIIEVRELIRSLAGDHTLLLSTHILAEVSMVCTRVAIIHRGRVVAEDTLANLTGGGQGAERFVIEVLGPA